MNTGRKITGGKYHKLRKKKLHELDRQTRKVKLGKEKRKFLKGKGGSKKSVLLFTEIVNVLDKKTGKTKKAKIKNVLETPSNKFLARQNIMTKGTIIETDIGKAKISNRPSQEGSINAILIEE
ncbi:MAG: 30S ribosomal protein S8e [Nanoarchaeota archaeon]